MTFHVKTAVFEGPLDLLLQLITKHQLEISSIGLAGVVGEYLAMVDEMQALDIEVTSEFLLIAATLIQLKARSLLPTGSGIELGEDLAFIEERDRLLSRLLACVTYKDVSAVLQRRLQEGNRLVPRVSGLDQNVARKSNLAELPVDRQALAAIALRVFERQLQEPDLDHLDLELPSVESAIADLRRRVADMTYASFEELTEECNKPMEVAAYFLALLELARWGLIEVSQKDWMSEIEIRHRTDGDIDLTSEWAST